MRSIRRLTVTAAAVAALAAPAAAQARPDISPSAHRALGTSAGVSEPRTQVVEADPGFDWSAAGVGAGAAVLVSVALGGVALSIRPRRVSANS
jgi:hypothetical protein